MTELRYTLLADGPSDDALLPILSWLLVEHMPRTAIQPQWADLGRLRDLLREASGLHGRRLKDLPVSARRVADLIDDFSPLRRLPAFQRLEEDVRDFVQQHGEEIS